MLTPAGPVYLIPDLIPELIPDLIPDLIPELSPDLIPDLSLNLSPDLIPDLIPDLSLNLSLNLNLNLIPDLNLNLIPDLILNLIPDLILNLSLNLSPGQRCQHGGADAARQRRAEPDHDGRRSQACRLVGGSHTGLRRAAVSRRGGQAVCQPLIPDHGHESALGLGQLDEPGCHDALLGSGVVCTASMTAVRPAADSGCGVVRSRDQ